MQSLEKKNIYWNIIGTSFNAIVSLFLLIFVTRINGKDQAGIFSFAFSVSLIFNVIGVYYGRVYQVSDKSGCTNFDFFISKLIMCSIMMITSIIFVFLNNYSFYKIIIILLLCFFKCIEAFSETNYAIIQKNGFLYKVGFSFFIKAIFSIFSFLIIDLYTKNLILSILSLIIIHILIIILYDIKNIIVFKIKKEYNKKNIIFLLKDGFYPFAITFLSLYIFNSSRFAIDLSLDNVSQTIFGIIIMPATVILMFVQYLLHPYLNKITDLYNKNNYYEINKILKRFIIYIILLTFFGLILSYTIAIPVFNIIYGFDLFKFQNHLLIIMLGAGFYGIVSLLMNIFIIMRKNKYQFVLLSIYSIFSFVISFYLTYYYKLFGSTISYSLLMMLLSFIYLISYIIYSKGGIYAKN